MILLRAYATWVVLAALALVVASYAVLVRDFHDETLRVLAMTLMAMMAIGTASAAGRCFVTPGWPAPKQWGSLGFFVLGICGFVSGVVSLFYRLAGRPDWVIELPLSNAWTYGLIAIGLVGVLGPGFFTHNLSVRTKRTIAGLWIAAVLAIGYLGLARPDLAPVAAWIKQNWIARSS